MPEISADICVIGASAGGLSFASGAAQLGRKVVLIDKAQKRDGFSLPSRALIAAARSAEAQRAGTEFGIAPSKIRVDSGKLYDHIRQASAETNAANALSQLESLGVTVLCATARFANRKTVRAGETMVNAKTFVIATGSRPFMPVLKGLDTIPYLTSETIFDEAVIPHHLIVVGGGSTGIELAQAYRRLGANVTVIDTTRMLAPYDHDLAAILFDRLRSEGIVLREGAKISSIEKVGSGVHVAIARVQGHETIEGSHLLVTAGRSPDLDGLDLQKAGIKTDDNGIKVDAELRTSNKRVYAIGDAAGAPRFTHVAEWHAGLLVRNLLLKQRAHTSYDAVPTVLHTDPEIASVGLSAADAEKRRIPFDNVTVSLEDTHRGKADRVGESLVKVVIGKKGRVLGVSMVAPNASELILPWLIVIAEAIPLARLADLVVSYPTFGEHMKRVTASYYSKTLFNKRKQLDIGLLARLR